MSPKNKGNNDRNTRSKSKTRGGQQGAAEAASHSPTPTFPEDNDTSDTRVGEDRGRNHNKEGKQRERPPVSQKVPAVYHIDESSSQELRGDHNFDLNSAVKEKQLSVTEINSEQKYGRPDEEGDNREVSIQTDFPAEVHNMFGKDSPVMALFEELKARLDTVDKIEATTSSLAEHFKKMEERTTKLEGSVKVNRTSIQKVQTEVTSLKSEIKAVTTSNTSSAAKLKEVSAELKKLKQDVKGSNTSTTAKVKEANAEIASLKEMVELQGKAIAKLTTLKTDLSKQNKEVKTDLIKQNQEFKADLSRKNEGIVGEMNKLLEQ